MVFTAGQKLRAGDLTNLDPPSAQAIRTSNQSINNSTDTYITWQLGPWDTGTSPFGMYNGSNQGLDIYNDGIYLIVAHVPWAFSATGTRIGRIHKVPDVGSTVGLIHQEMAGSVGGLITTKLVAVENLVVGDLLRVIVWQNSGGALNVLGHASDPESRCTLSATMLRPM